MASNRPGDGRHGVLEEGTTSVVGGVGSCTTWRRVVNTKVYTAPVNLEGTSE